jgi:uncharacterized protein (TIGR02996 family)
LYRAARRLHTIFFAARIAGRARGVPMSAADRAAFLRAIAENPDDDLPRLVYADWLDEHGQPERAEFIRVQIELARMPPDDPRRSELVDRQAELVSTPGRSWQPIQPPGVTLRFERGFVQSVMVSNYSAFIECAAELFATEPIYYLNIDRPRPQHLRDLARRPFLARVTCLVAEYGTISNDAVSAFARSPHTASLRLLNLSGNRVGDVGAQALAESASLTSLRRLGLSMNQITDTGGEALAASPFFGKLEQLILGVNEISPDVQSLLRARYGGAVKF